MTIKKPTNDEIKSSITKSLQDALEKPTNDEIKSSITKSLQDALEKHILPGDDKAQCRLKLSLMLKRLGLTDETEIEARLKKNMKHMIQDMMIFGQTEVQLLTDGEADDALKPDRRTK